MLKKMFLKLDGVRGASESPRHVGEIEITSFTWGGNHPQNFGAGGGGAGKASFNDLIVFKRPDKTTSLLFVASAAGQHFVEGVFTIEDVSESGSLLRSVILKMKSVMLDHVTPREDVDEVALNFEDYKMMRS